MRQISIEEAGAVGGADCGDLSMSVSLSGVSISGSFDTWGSCLSSLGDLVTDKYYGYTSQYTTGIPYGEAHVG